MLKKNVDRRKKKEEGKSTPLAVLAEVSVCKVSHGALCKNRELTCCVTGRRRARESASASHADGFRKTSRQLGVPTATTRSLHRTWQPASSSSSSFCLSCSDKTESGGTAPCALFLCQATVVLDEAKRSKDTYTTQEQEGKVHPAST